MSGFFIGVKSFLRGNVKLKRLLFIVLALALFSVAGAVEYPEHEAATVIDSLDISATVYTAVDSIAVDQDTAATTLLFVTGDLELSAGDKCYLAIATDTTSAGAPQIVLGNDTTVVTAHEYSLKVGPGVREARMPFSFVQPVSTDSTAVVTVYLMGKTSSQYHIARVYNLRIDALVHARPMDDD